MAALTRVTPVTLCFVRAAGQLLLLRGAPGRLFAGQLNGAGGHLRPGEDPCEAASRELAEESGLELDPAEWSLRGVIHETGLTEDDRMLFVFVAELEAPTALRSSHEGTLAWYPIDTLPWNELVPDLHEILPLVLETEQVRVGTLRYCGDSHSLEIR